MEPSAAVTAASVKLTPVTASETTQPQSTAPDQDVKREQDSANAEEPPMDMVAKGINAFVGITVVASFVGVVRLVYPINDIDYAWGSVLDAYWGHASTVLWCIGLAGFATVMILLGFVAVITNGSCNSPGKGKLAEWFTILACLNLLLAAIAATTIGIGGNAICSDWQNKTYPAQRQEEAVKHEFDDVSCRALRVSACRMNTAGVAVTMFVPDSSTIDPSIFVAELSGLCYNSAALTPGFDVMCEQCGVADNAPYYFREGRWISDKCPATPSNLRWCGAYFTGNTTVMAAETAPYTHCRRQFLGAMSKNLLFLGVSGVLVLAPLECIAIVLCLGLVVMIFRLGFSGAYAMAAVGRATTIRLFAAITGRSTLHERNQATAMKMTRNGVFIDASSNVESLGSPHPPTA